MVAFLFCVFLLLMVWFQCYLCFTQCLITLTDLVRKFFHKKRSDIDDFVGLVYGDCSLFIYFVGDCSLIQTQSFTDNLISFFHPTSYHHPNIADVRHSTSCFTPMVQWWPHFDRWTPKVSMQPICLYIMERQDGLEFTSEGLWGPSSS